MSKDRLEAFSDGVIAILITIMALESAHPARHHLGPAARGSAGAAGLPAEFENIGSSARSSPAIATPMAPAPCALHRAGRSRRCRLWRRALVARRRRKETRRGGACF